MNNLFKIFFGMTIFFTLFCTNAKAEINLKDNNVNNYKFTKNVDIQKKSPYLNIDNIVLEVKNININIVQENRNDIKIHVYGEIKSDKQVNEPEVVINENSGILNVKIDPNLNGYNEFLSYNVKCNIYVPISYNKDLTLKTNSYCVLNKLTINNIDMEKDSGDVYIDTVKVENIKINSKFGKIIAKNSNVKELLFKLESGDVNLSDINSNKININTSYGNLDIKKCSGEMQCKTKGGNIQAYLYNIIENISMDTSYGTITANIDNNAMFNITAESYYGHIYNDFKLSNLEQEDMANGSKISKLKGNNGESNNNIMLRTNNGNIKIKSM